MSNDAPLPPVPPANTGPGAPPPGQPYPSPAPAPPASSGRLKGCLLVAGLLVLMGSMLVNLVLFAALIGKSEARSTLQAAKPYQEEFVDGDRDADSKILLLEITGVITNFSDSEITPSMVEIFRRQLRQGVGDDAIKAILIKINSPGGEVMASDILYHEIKKAREEKPLMVFMESVAASGGFYAAMGSEFVMANELTLTGSIGVIVQTLTYEQLGEKIGVKFNTFTSGPNKAMFGGPTQITPQQAEIIRSIVEESYGRFVGIVGESRQIDPDELRAKLADGRVLTGEQAKEAGLIDELGYVEDAYAKARELGKAKDAQIIRYRPEINFLELFSIFGEAQANPTLEVNLLPHLPRLRPGMPYYLAPHLLLSP
ncbi:MAG: signal peptide peptidase SppA [Verrucomicrobiota bacterium]